MEGTFIGVLLIIYGFMILISIAALVIMYIGMWKLFKLAGDPGWHALIPVYNFMRQVKLALGSYLFALIYLAIVVFYMLFYVAMGVCAVYYPEVMQTSVFLVIMMIPYIFSVPMLAIVSYVRFMFAKSFGRDTAMCVLSIFFSPITYFIMAIDNKSRYIGPVK